MKVTPNETKITDPQLIVPTYEVRSHVTGFKADENGVRSAIIKPTIIQCRTGVVDCDENKNDTTIHNRGTIKNILPLLNENQINRLGVLQQGISDILSDVLEAIERPVKEPTESDV